MPRLPAPLRGLLDLVYPRSCVVCGGEIGGEISRHLCWECARQIRFQSHEAFCSRCGRDIPGPHTGTFVCSACRTRPPAFDVARSAAHFEGPTRTLIHELKYHGGDYLVPEVTDLLEACHSRHYASEGADVVCPVPLHVARRLQRGYNQSALLGAELARRLALPFVANLLVRTRDTPTQTHLSAEQRRENMRDAFAVNPALHDWARGRRILLVDDVMTTGATLSEAAGALRRAGAARVLALTVARD